VKGTSVKVVTPQPIKMNASVTAGGKSSTTDSKPNPGSLKTNEKVT